MQCIVDVAVPLVDTETGSTRGVLPMPCFRDADGVRHFFGPLLVRASRMQRAQSVYRKIRNVTTRRVATDDEVAFVRRHHPQLYMRVMRERRLQIDEAARRVTRKRACRRRALQRAREPFDDGDDGTAINLDASVAKRVDEDACALATPALVMCDSDDETLAAGVIVERSRTFNDTYGDINDEPMRRRHVADNQQRQEQRQREEDDNEEEQEGDDDRDGDYDADGAGDLTPAAAHRQATARGSCAVTASTIYLVEATSRLIEFLGSGLVLSDDTHEPPPGRGPAAALEPLSCRPICERTWPEIEPTIASWAATRYAAFDATHRDRSHEPPGRRRKQDRPTRALLPIP